MNLHVAGAARAGIGLAAAGLGAALFLAGACSSTSGSAPDTCTNCSDAPTGDGDADTGPATDADTGGGGDDVDTTLPGGVCDPLVDKPKCVTTNEIRECLADGSAYSIRPCAEGLSCFQGECVDYECAPGAKACTDAHTVSVCLTDESGSFAWSAFETCDEHSLCQEGACVPVCGYDPKFNDYKFCEWWQLNLSGSGEPAGCVGEDLLVAPSSNDNKLAVFDISVDPPEMLEGSPFPTCQNPSRIMMDAFRDVIASCRNDGNVWKHTRNGEVLWKAHLPNSFAVRGIVTSSDNRLFAGCSSTGQVHEIDPDTGDILASVPSGVSSIYGLAIDDEGIYASELGGQLSKLYLGGANDLEIAWTIQNVNGYGVTTDRAGKVWVAASPGMVAYEALDGALATVVSQTGVQDQPGGGDPFGGWGICNGITVAIDGRVIAGCPDSGQDIILIFDPLTEEVQKLSLNGKGSHPRGVVADAAGNIYTINLNSNNATRIDAITGEMRTFGAGALSGPYGYSGDMTGTANCVGGKGAVSWTSKVLDFGEEKRWLFVTWEGEAPEGSSIEVWYRIDKSPWIQVFDAMDIDLVGETFQVRARLSSDLPGVVPTLTKLAVIYDEP